jgi:hypothetical protein
MKRIAKIEGSFKTNQQSATVDLLDNNQVLVTWDNDETVLFATVNGFLQWTAWNAYIYKVNNFVVPQVNKYETKALMIATENYLNQLLSTLS